MSLAAENDRRVLQLPYHGANTALVSTHDVRLPKDSTVGDLLEAFMQQLPAEKRPRQLRLLEIFNCKIYQARLASVIWPIASCFWDRLTVNSRRSIADEQAAP